MYVYGRLPYNSVGEKILLGLRLEENMRVVTTNSSEPDVADSGITICLYGMLFDNIDFSNIR